MTNEKIVRDVVGYEGLYSVDIFGNVYKTNGKELTQSKNKFGYMFVSLTKDGKQKQHRIHRLVAQAFIPNPQHKEQVNHIDGDKTHNTVWNLEWCTCKENINHSIKTGLRPQMKVRVVETGKVYNSVIECANDVKGSFADIYKCLQGFRKTHKKYHYEVIENVE